MKILYVVSGQSYSSDRLGRKISAIVNCWKGMGHEVELVCGNDVLPAGRREAVQANQANLANPPWYRRSSWLQPLVNTVSEWANIRHDRRLAEYVRMRINSFEPDLYVQRSSRIDGRTLKVAISSGVTTVLEWKDNIVVSSAARKSVGRGDLYGFSFLKPYARWVEKWKEKNVPWIIVESEVLKERLSRNIARDSSKIVVAHNAVNIREFAKEKIDCQRARRELGLPGNPFLAVFVGSFNWYQHVEYLVLAIASDECPESIHAVLVGDGEHREACEDLAKQLNVSDRCHFVGRVPHDQVPRYLASANAAVLPDCTEIIAPIKVQEYMAMGIASVVPDYRANREVFEDGITGVLFKPRDVVALAQELERLMEHPEQCEKIGVAAKCLAGERFTWEATWGKAVEFIVRSDHRGGMGV